MFFITRIPFAIRWMQDMALQARYMWGLVSAAWHLSVLLYSTAQYRGQLDWPAPDSWHVSCPSFLPAPALLQFSGVIRHQAVHESGQSQETGDRSWSLYTALYRRRRLRQWESERVRVSPGQDTDTADTSRRRLRLWPRWHPPVTHHNYLVIITFAVCDQ